MEAIHAALNEPEVSAATSEAIDRVARALGARDGTGPDEQPWLRRQRERSRLEGRLEGERTTLVRVAARRFDAATAAELGRPAAAHARPGAPRRGVGPDPRLRHGGGFARPCGRTGPRRLTVRGGETGTVHLTPDLPRKLARSAKTPPSERGHASAGATRGMTRRPMRR